MVQQALNRGSSPFGLVGTSLQQTQTPPSLWGGRRSLAFLLSTLATDVSFLSIFCKYLSLL